MKENRHQEKEFYTQWKEILRGVPHSRKFLKGYTSFAGQTAFQQSNSTRAGVKFTVPCFRLANAVTILWDGTACACCYDADGTMPVGDIRKESLRAIWKGSPMNTLRDLHARKDLASLALCKNCDVVHRVFSRRR